MSSEREDYDGIFETPKESEKRTPDEKLGDSIGGMVGQAFDYGLKNLSGQAIKSAIKKAIKGREKVFLIIFSALLFLLICAVYTVISLFVWIF